MTSCLRIRKLTRVALLLPLYLAWLVFGHLADHVVEDASVVEIRQLHIGVESHPHLESFPRVEL